MQWHPGQDGREEPRRVAAVGVHVQEVVVLVLDRVAHRVEDRRAQPELAGPVDHVHVLGSRPEVIRDVAIPYGRRAMVGAVMLGLGRALGETMAVVFIIGNATRLSPNLFAQGSTIASTAARFFADRPSRCRLARSFAVRRLPACLSNSGMTNRDRSS